MKIEINKIITLGNGEEYLTLAKAVKDNVDYFYIALVNLEKTDIENNYKIVKIVTKDNNQYIEEVLGENNLREILPLFIEKED